jgi:hypothetical protein
VRQKWIGIIGGVDDDDEVVLPHGPVDRFDRGAEGLRQIPEHLLTNPNVYLRLAYRQWQMTRRIPGTKRRLVTRSPSRSRA